MCLIVAPPGRPHACFLHFLSSPHFLSHRSPSPQHPDFFAAHLAEAVVALNGCDDHPIYLAAASRYCSA